MTDDIYREIGALIKKHRKRNNLSREQLGAMVFITVWMLGSYERGENRVPLDVLFKIAEVLKIRVDELLPQSIRPPQ